MAQSFTFLGNGSKLSTDVVSVTIEGKTYDLHRQHVIAVQSGDAEQMGFPLTELLQQPLVRASDSAQNLGVDGSATAQDFEYIVPADKGLLLEEVRLLIRKTGSAFDAVTFAGLAALANGLQLRVLSSGGVEQENLLIDEAKDFGDLLRHCDGYAQPLPGVATMSVRTSRAGAAMFVDAGQKVRATVRDNLSTLDEFRVTLIGRLMP